MTFTIRRAAEDDSASLAAVEMITAPEFATFLLDGMFEDASVGAVLSWRYRQGGVDSTEWSWIAERDGDVLGAMGAYPVALSKAEWNIDSGEASDRNAHFAPLKPLMRDEAFHIARLGVLPQARRQGVASALVDTAAEIARQSALPVLTLLVWADNDPACALYSRLGFTERDAANIDAHPRLSRHGKMLLLGKDIT